MLFPKKQRAKNELTLAEYREMVKNNSKMIPKKSLLQPGRSKTMRAVCPESLLQKATNEAIELRRWQYIRFDGWFMAWMRQQHPKYQKHFFEQVAGKLPDNLILVELGKGFFLGCKLELKTEDSKGRAVGSLHGKQKRYALNEGWPIARNTKQVCAVLDMVDALAKKMRETIEKSCAFISHDIY